MSDYIAHSVTHKQTTVEHFTARRSSFVGWVNGTTTLCGRFIDGENAEPHGSPSKTCQRCVRIHEANMKRYYY